MTFQHRRAACDERHIAAVFEQPDTVQLTGGQRQIADMPIS
ncbi:hypothetical protein [Paenibacillus sp. S150]|nr:hypothetical protein [Paenibacillus sp. S150]